MKILQSKKESNQLKNFCNNYEIDYLKFNSIYKSGNISKLLSMSENELELYNKFCEKKYIYDKYGKLINEFEYAEENYCGIGILQTKKLLERLSDIDINAKSLKIALEIEENNINAKKLCIQSIYSKKEELILELIKLCEENNIKYGFGESDILGIPFIIYFDLACGQVSWHTMLDSTNYKWYGGVWDGIEHATLSKIESFIKNNYLMS